MTRTRIVEDVAQLEALAPKWRALVASDPACEPVVTPTWTLAWWRNFGTEDGRKLRAVVVEDGEELVGLALVSLRTVYVRRAIPVRRLELLMTGEIEADEICSDYVGVLTAPGREREVATAFADVLASEDVGVWDDFVFSAMNGEAPFVRAWLDVLRERNLEPELEVTGRCPYVRLPATWEEYLAMLDGGDRYIVSRALRDLEKWAGKDGFALHRAEDAASLSEGWRILTSLHGERWSERGSKGVFASSRFSKFHEEVMAHLLAGTDGRLDLMWLTVKGEPIAAVYNVVHAGKTYFYQSGRKLDLPKGIRAGIVLHALAIRRAIAEGQREYDFLNGEAQYKRQLATAVRDLVTIRASASTLRARAVAAATNLAERAIESVRSPASVRSPLSTRGSASSPPTSARPSSSTRPPPSVRPSSSRAAFRVDLRKRVRRHRPSSPSSTRSRPRTSTRRRRCRSGCRP
ncbi:MAG: GNAT family N-acetyltransferase [Polyangiaceae bacterium]